MRLFAAIFVLSLACLGCGIPEAVGDECGPQRSDYDMLMKRSNGMKERGVAPDAPTYRHTRELLARAREAVLECTGRSG